MPFRSAGRAVGFFRLIKPAGAAVAGGVLLAACASARGVHHRVEAGETIARIARAYGVTPRSILSANGLRDPSDMRPGREIVIPGASRAAPVPTWEEFRDLVLGPYLEKGIRWPVKGAVSSVFGGRGSGKHTGIDILAPEGTEVRAALPGLVVHCGNALRGYGNVVVLDHGQSVTTLYGHLKEIRVQSGEAVAGGAVVGTVGMTGNASSPHLHFELRVEDRPVDPQRYLDQGSRSAP